MFIEVSRSIDHECNLILFQVITYTGGFIVTSVTGVLHLYILFRVYSVLSEDSSLRGVQSCLLVFVLYCSVCVIRYSHYHGQSIRSFGAFRAFTVAVSTSLYIHLLSLSPVIISCHVHVIRRTGSAPHANIVRQLD